MSNSSITLADAERILSAEPQATNRAVEAVFSAVNTANHIYSGIEPYGPAVTYPDLNAEFRDFQLRRKGLSLAEGYIVAKEGEAHFTTRLREAEAVRDAASKARFDRNLQNRLFETRAAMAAEWRLHHGRELTALCQSLSDSIAVTREGLKTVSNDEDIERVRDALGVKLQSAVAVIINSIRK